LLLLLATTNPLRRRRRTSLQVAGERMEEDGFQGRGGDSGEQVSNAGVALWATYILICSCYYYHI